MSRPTIAQQSVPTITPGGSGVGTRTVTFPFTKPAKKDSLLVILLSGDKNFSSTGYPITGSDSVDTGGAGWSAPVNLPYINVSLYALVKTAKGGETNVRATYSNDKAQGGIGLALELVSDEVGPWQVYSATSPTNEGNIGTVLSGTTASVPFDGLGIALASVDSFSNISAATRTWSNGFVSLFAPVTADLATTSDAPLYVATKNTDKNTTVSTSLAFSAGTDQMSGAVLVVNKAVLDEPDPAVLHRWMGFDKIAIKTRGSSSVRIAYSASNSMTDPIVSDHVAPDAQGWSHHKLPAMPGAATRYYQVWLNGVPTGAVTQFKTLPGKTAANFKFGFASCRDETEGGGNAVFAEMATRGVDLFIQTGDIHYRDLGVTGSTTNPQRWRDALDTVFEPPALAAMLAKTPFDYIASDHDTTGDSSNKNSAGMDMVRQVYRERVPSPALPGAGLYHTFRVGRVRFIVLDTRTYRDPVAQTDNSSKTMIGAEQKAWLQGLLAAPDAPLTFLVSPEPWVGAASLGEDNWKAYSTERTQIAGWITAATATKVIVIAGDMHGLAIDNGTNALPAGTHVWQAAPLNRPSGSVKGGPYSGGTHISGNNKYGHVTITDDGTTITAKFDGILSGGTVWATDTVTVTSAAVAPTAKMWVLNNGVPLQV